MTLRRKQTGFTLLEFAVSVIIIGVLSGVLLQRLVLYQHEADQAYAERMAAVLRSALVLRVAHLTAQGKENDIAALVHDNPMDWLEKKPASYIGEYFSPISAEIPPRSWYFDRRAKVLVYVPARAYLPGAATFSAPAPALHYRLVLVSTPSSKDGQKLAGTSLELVRLDSPNISHGK